MQPTSPSAGHPALSSPAFVEFIVVRAGTHLFGIDVEAAVEIRGPETFDPPGSGASPTLTVRDQGLPVVDLRQAVGLPGFDHGCPAMLLMHAGLDLIALAVDEVRDIESVPPQQVQPAADSPFPFCTHRATLSTGAEVLLINPTLIKPA